MHTARNADRQRLIETESNFHLSSLFFNPVILIFFLSQLSQSLQRSGRNADRFYLVETEVRVNSHFSGILISSSLSISFWAMSVKLVLQWRQAMPGQGQQFSFSLLSDFRRHTKILQFFNSQCFPFCTAIFGATHILSWKPFIFF